MDSSQSQDAYTVVAEQGSSSRSVRSGLSHAEAMKVAEMLRREGQVVRIMHVTGDKSCEVDHYPAR